MTYTIKQLAKLSGVSIRTLRFYDKKDLLKPAYVGNNRYRYYEEKQLLQLQQILFFREFGFSLKAIKQQLCVHGFNQFETLMSHRQELVKRLDRLGQLLSTLDKTIDTLKGERTMKPEEMYQGFQPADLPRLDEIAIQLKGEMAKQMIERRQKRIAHLTDADWEAMILQRNKIQIEWKACLEQQLPPTDEKVQALIQQWFELFTKPFYDPNQEEWLIILEINCTEPEYRKSFDFYHPDLAAYVLQAGKVFAEYQWSRAVNIR